VVSFGETAAVAAPLAPLGSVKDREQLKQTLAALSIERCTLISTPGFAWPWQKDNGARHRRIADSSPC